jgi:hypothetical protein
MSMNRMQPFRLHRPRRAARLTVQTAAAGSPDFPLSANCRISCSEKTYNGGETPPALRCSVSPSSTVGVVLLEPSDADAGVDPLMAGGALADLGPTRNRRQSDLD